MRNPLFAVTFLAAGLAAAETCVPLKGSTSCSAFGAASVSTNANMTKLFSFLAFVSDTNSFDQKLQDYIATQYSLTKYQDPGQIGCSSVNLTNTTSIYARYTTSFLCNAIVQNSISYCGLSDSDSIPLCADSCAQFAINEQVIASTPDLCGTYGSHALDQIRADFSQCTLPKRSISDNCISGATNEPTNCGFQSNLGGLCTYCSVTSPNATDYCCITAKADERCQGVHLPTTTSMAPLFPSSTSTSAAGAGAGGKKSLSGGQIAGIIVGSVLGVALVVAGVVFACLLMRRRRQSQSGSPLNHPSPIRRVTGSQAMAYNNDGTPPMVPGARVARMAALEESSTSTPSVGALGGYQSHSSGYNTPRSRHGVPAGSLPKRSHSLSSSSALAPRHSPQSPASPTDNEQFSSPDGIASGESEQLNLFKDYYSQDEIRPNDVVATLWAYQPRANDEFELERGDMLRIVGIWDDGWATGIKLSEKVEEWEARRGVLRDSGVSNGSRDPSASREGEIKAFPLVCVCLPRHWRKTIEGEGEGLGQFPADF